MAKRRKQQLEGVLFDWDGTLIDSYHADTSAYLAMFKEMGIGWGLEELEKNYSPNWYQVYRAAKLPRTLWNDADRSWRAHYAKHRPKLISGVRRVLSRLGGKHSLGLVTSGDRDRVLRQLRQFRLTRLFSARVCSGDTLRKKPHPEPLKLALRQMKLEPESCVYVGDSAQDVEMARSAGVLAIGVLGPFPTERRLRAARPEFLIRSLKELPDVLQRLRT
ncbi:MAG TPA: HAD family hydrolase [Candidatus Acidoferrum sp.]|jgi:pyrophosphatase PpaX|nr:HAD family hydrolase [Candidatus Acidoferrum sp.]HZC65081.1 HAD family hydrolase [Candidatus Dormibacteraeota bacterium]